MRLDGRLWEASRKLGLSSGISVYESYNGRRPEGRYV